MISIEIAKYFQSGTILAVTALSIAAFPAWQNRAPATCCRATTASWGSS